MSLRIRTKMTGFTLIELVLIVAIVGILATLGVQSYDGARTRAYNTNLRGSVGEYSQAMDLYYAQSHTYFVTWAGAGATTCEAPYDLGKVEKISGTPWGYTLQGYGNGSPTCVGLDGGSQGRMTRSHIHGTTIALGSSRGGGMILQFNHAYDNYSIADALVSQGVLKEVRAYPGVDSFQEDSPDFVLTLCNAQGQQATGKADALNFAVYASLKGAATSVDTSKVHSLCGSADTRYGWNYVEDWEDADLPPAP
ncbi:MAG: hypothetical protein WCO52_00605 [bacterium]